VNDLLTRLWRLGKPLQWRFLWLMHAKFICGITGVVRDDHGRVLLLRHRLWPPGRQWGFPTGYANKGERHEDTIAREVREETGLTVKAGRLLKAGNSPLASEPWTGLRCSPHRQGCPAEPGKSASLLLGPAGRQLRRGARRRQHIPDFPEGAAHPGHLAVRADLRHGAATPMLLEPAGTRHRGREVFATKALVLSHVKFGCPGDI
jgi:8-oxo-dGTP pyrophosphatase MutT (NUDIX family)